jgi:flagellar protein FlaG
MDIRPISSPSVAEPGTASRAANAVAPAAVAAPAAAAPVQASALVQQPGATAKSEQVKQAVEQINKLLQAQSQQLEFTMDKDTNEVVVKVIDQQTREVIRQIPSEEALDIAKSIDRIQNLRVKQQA